MLDEYGKRLLQKSAAVIRQQEQSIADLQAKVKNLEREKEASAIADEMISRGILDSENRDRKIGSLMKESETDFELTKKALDVYQRAPDLGRVDTEESKDENSNPLDDLLARYASGERDF